MLQSLLRTLLMYSVILLAVRIMGKRQISQLQTSELVVTLLISELAVLPIQEHEEPLWNGLIPMAVIVACEIGISLLMLKSSKFRQVICGKPVLVIENGKVLQHQMRKLRMSTEELFEELRLDGVFTLEEVAYAVIETNGTLSILRHKKDDFLTPKQAGVRAEEEYPELVVVSDGELSPSSLRLVGRDRAWVEERIRGAGLTREQVFIMTATADGKSQIIPKEPKK